MRRNDAMSKLLVLQLWMEREWTTTKQNEMRKRMRDRLGGVRFVHYAVHLLHCSAWLAIVYGGFFCHCQHRPRKTPNLGHLQNTTFIKVVWWEDTCCYSYCLRSMHYYVIVLHDDILWRTGWDSDEKSFAFMTTGIWSYMKTFFNFNFNIPRVYPSLFCRFAFFMVLFCFVCAAVLSWLLFTNHPPRHYHMCTIHSCILLYVFYQVASISRTILLVQPCASPNTTAPISFTETFH